MTEEERRAVMLRWRRSFSERWPRELRDEYAALLSDTDRFRFFLDHPDLGKEKPHGNDA